MKLPDFKKLFAKKEEPVETSEISMPSKPLPSDLEKFRMERTDPTPLGASTPTAAEERYGTIPERQPPTPVTEPAPTPAATGDRIDLILQKLETVDTRLKLIEEKMK